MKLDYARAIRTARAYCKLSKTVLAKKSGYSVATLTSWERGYSKPTPESLANIAESLGVTSRFLLVLALEDGWANLSFDEKILDNVPQYSMTEVYALTGLSATTLLTYKKDGVFQTTGAVTAPRCSELDIQKIKAEKAKRVKARLQNIAATMELKFKSRHSEIRP